MEDKKLVDEGQNPSIPENTDRKDSLVAVAPPFTEGPWKVETPRDREDSLSDEGDPEWDESYPKGVTVRAAWATPREGLLGYEICRMAGVHKRTLPNARLIAAAPALYERLKDVLQRCAEREVFMCDDFAHDGDCNCEGDKAYAAIALASGQMPPR
jgi:hypothetical protein